mgnify:CR=1 FL=1
MGIKFNQHHVTDGATKARVFYSLDNRTDGRACVTIYAREEMDDIVMLMLQPVTRWPDRADLEELADEMEAKKVPMVIAILLGTDEEAEWRATNLRAEEGWTRG